MSPAAQKLLGWERQIALPTAGVIVKGCLDDCDVCEPSLDREIELELERKQPRERAAEEADRAPREVAGVPLLPGRRGRGARAGPLGRREGDGVLWRQACGGPAAGRRRATRCGGGIRRARSRAPACSRGRRRAPRVRPACGRAASLMPVAAGDGQVTAR